MRAARLRWNQFIFALLEWQHPIDHVFVGSLFGKSKSVSFRGWLLSMLVSGTTILREEHNGVMERMLQFWKLQKREQGKFLNFSVRIDKNTFKSIQIKVHLKEIKVYLAADFCSFLVPFWFNYAPNSWKEFLLTVKDFEILEREKNSTSKFGIELWQWIDDNILRCNFSSGHFSLWKFS